MNKTISKSIVLLIAIVIAYNAFVEIRSPEPQLKRYRDSANIMHTRVTVTVVADSHTKAREAIDIAFQRIRSIENAVSFWTDKSEIAEINRQAGVSPVKVSHDTFRMAEAALRVASGTSGAFDPTVGPVMRLWDFKKQSIPGIQELDSALALVDYRNVLLDHNAASIYLSKRGMSFDTGGIAKGYAADEAVNALKQAGVTSALVAIAGDIRAYGSREDGQPWTVGIRDPRGMDEEDIIATVNLVNSAISTSGDYERFFIKGGKRHHHLIDPGTGHPASGLMSFSVIAPSAVVSDGFSTGAFVLGIQGGTKALQDEGLEGIAIDSEGKAHVSSGLKDNIQWVPDKFKPVD